jgi:hypothetical protein
MSDSEKKELDEAQEDQDEVGEAGSDPETSGPAAERACVKRLPRQLIKANDQKSQPNLI